ncbi:MAG: sulfite exporter TauE/SafE family protein [Anaerolineae bacterium]
MNLWVIFLTGLTTGGLTCLAVQGGLLATAITKQVSIVHQEHAVKGKRAKEKQRHMTGVQVSQNALPVAAFLTAKLIAHTLIGFLLGALGSVVQLTPTVQAVMQIVAGMFMIGTALNMPNVHPIFRYFCHPAAEIFNAVGTQSVVASQDVFAPTLGAGSPRS